MPRSARLFGSILISFVVACSSSSGPSPARGGSGGGATGGTATGGGTNGGATSFGGSAVGSSGSGGTISNPSGGATSNAGNASGGASAAGAPSGGASSAGAGGQTGGGGAGTACGYMNQGHVLNVTPDISLCIPPQHCLPETCPPTLGKCVNDACVYDAGYSGLETLAQAWATHYCDLQSGACQGVHQNDPVLTTAQNVATKAALPLCKSSSAGAKCVGIVANPPMMIGNREKFGENWGLGLTEPSGLCYEVTGPGGSALLAITDRCGGFCKCPSLGANDFNECGQCKEATDLTPLCECRGPNSCATTTEQCDWCAANNHPHFDTDDDTFNHLCGDEAIKGSCQLTNVKFVPCLTPSTSWPPAL